MLDFTRRIMFLVNLMPFWIALVHFFSIMCDILKDLLCFYSFSVLVGCQFLLLFCFIVVELISGLFFCFLPSVPSKNDSFLHLFWQKDSLFLIKVCDLKSNKKKKEMIIVD